MSLDVLNYTLLARNTFPTLVPSIGPILDSAIMVDDDATAKTISVPYYAARTGSEFTQASNGYTANDADAGSVDIVVTEIYDEFGINALRFAQSGHRIIEGMMPVMGAAVAKKMFSKMNDLVTAAAYTNTAITSTAANWDADDMADAATGLSNANASEIGRYAIFTPDYYGALSKDSQIQSAYAFGDDSVIKRNEIISVHGFSVHKATAIAASGDVANLKGWLASKEAFAVAMRPSIDTHDVPAYARVGSFTDPATKITMSVRVWDDMNGKIMVRVATGFGIARGQTAALTILKSA